MPDQQTLAAEAFSLACTVERQLQSAAALMLPAATRSSIAALAQLVHRLALRVDSLTPKA